MKLTLVKWRTHKLLKFWNSNWRFYTLLTWFWKIKPVNIYKIKFLSPYWLISRQIGGENEMGSWVTYTLSICFLYLFSFNIPSSNISAIQWWHKSSRLQILTHCWAPTPWAIRFNLLAEPFPDWGWMQEDIFNLHTIRGKPIHYSPVHALRFEHTNYNSYGLLVSPKQALYIQCNLSNPALV